ncbi:MAG: response regulator transcription factor [Mycobacteriales bacterium]
MSTVAVVDDEHAIRQALRSALAAAGYEAVEAADGPAAVDLVATTAPDIVVLDLGLPGYDGVEVVRRIRSFSDVPIIILSVLDRDTDKIRALDAGADDYVTKPFSVDELLARVRAALRRLESVSPSSARVRIGRATVDLAQRSVEVAGEPVRLTPTQWELLSEFVANPGRLLTHKHLISAVWGGESGSEASSLRIYVSNLRRILEDVPANPKHLLTEVGAGYRLIGVEPAD